MTSRLLRVTVSLLLLGLAREKLFLQEETPLFSQEETPPMSFLFTIRAKSTDETVLCMLVTLQTILKQTV